MDTGLKERRVLVTGATGGLGGGIIRAFAAEGARVVIHGRDRTRAEAARNALIAQGAEAAIVLGELKQDADAARIAAEAAEAFGGIDILVNNAGGEGALTKPWLDIEPDEWLDLYSSNHVGAVRLVRTLAPGMIERRWGRIVNISAGSAVRPFPIGAHYSAAKAAVSNATVSLAANLGGHGITVNSILCGPIHTPAIQEIWTNLAASHGWGDEWTEIEAKAIRQMAPNPLGRLGRIPELAAAVLFLASEPASFINGASLRVDGGALGVV